MDNQANGGTQLTYGGVTTSNPFAGIGLSFNAAALTSTPTPITQIQGNGIRVAIPDPTRDIYLSVVGFGNLYGSETRSLDAQIVSQAGNQRLGRPRTTQAGDLARRICEQSGLATMTASGWFIPASVLATKSFTPPGSAVAYVDLALENVDTQAAYLTGFIAETA